MTETVLSNRFLVRGGTAANLATVNEVLKVRELCFETDTGKWKMGDGTTAWNSLAYRGTVDDSITDGVTNRAPSQNAVFDALALKVDASGLSESIDDRVAALLVQGTNITLTYNDALGTLTIDATDGGSTPTGTGLYGVTGGVMDAAAVTVGSGLDLTAGVLTATGGSFDPRDSWLFG